MLLEVHNMDIQLCCFLAGIYVGVHLFGSQNISTCFQKFKSSNVFYARVRQMMLRSLCDRQPSAGARHEVASILYFYLLFLYTVILEKSARIILCDLNKIAHLHIVCDFNLCNDSQG